MGRRDKGRKVDGWLVLDKPVGMTSTDAVARVKRLFNAGKAGHAGTLDPLASGCLPIALGEATKTVSHVMDGRKLYRFTVRWGEETATDDAEGAVTETSDLRPDEVAIRALLPDFTGRIMQVPPRFSAVKIAGERAYDLARDGEIVELEPREIVIHRLDLLECPDPDHAVFEAECGKGAYVRALARDMGRRLGARGHVVALRRLAVGPFSEAKLVELESLAAARQESAPSALDAFLHPVAAALAELPEVKLSQAEMARVRRGQPIILRGRDAPVEADAVHATHAGDSVAVGAVERGEFHPRRVFQL